MYNLTSLACSWQAYDECWKGIKKKPQNKPGHGKILHYSASKDLLFFSEPELKMKSKLQICKSNPHSVKATWHKICGHLNITPIFNCWTSNLIWLQEITSSGWLWMLGDSVFSSFFSSKDLFWSWQMVSVITSWSQWQHVILRATDKESQAEIIINL